MLLDQRVQYSTQCCSPAAPNAVLALWHMFLLVDYGNKTGPANTIHVRPPLPLRLPAASPTELDRRRRLQRCRDRRQHRNHSASSVKGSHETWLPPFSQSFSQSMYTPGCTRWLLSAGCARSQELLHCLEQLLLLEGFRDVAVHSILCAFLMGGLDDIGSHCQDR